MQIADPLKLIALYWPKIRLYNKQREILYSLAQNDETFVPAANQLGKDYIAGLAVLYFFLSRHPCRIVTTSVDATQLEAVLWGEIRRFIQDAEVPLTVENGGPLVVNHCHIRKSVKGQICGLSYIMGRVANQTGEGMLGHHIAPTGDGVPRTLFVADEASGVPHIYYDKADTWAKRKLVIGNPFPCENFFKHAVKGKAGTTDKGGDIPRGDGREGFFRKVIHISAHDSPNVKLGLKQIKEGRKPTYQMLFPGVKDFDTYQKNLRLWDPIKKCISLDGRFYEGAEINMFPPQWLDRAEQIAEKLPRFRKGWAIGCDPAEGGDSSCWSVVDDKGLIYQLSLKTPDTSIITKQTIELIEQYKVDPENVWFDRGGGGKQHVDRLRKDGYNVKTLGFGEPASIADRFKRFRRSADKQDDLETRTIYKNRRAELYGIMRQLIDPIEQGFGIPAQYIELRRQMAPIPLRYVEGKVYLLPKHKTNPNSNEMTLIELLGCSPDEADSLALACFGLMEASAPKLEIGAVEI